MLKNIKAFINVQFKISEVEDDVYSSSESEDEEQEEESKGEEESDASDFVKPKKDKSSHKEGMKTGGPSEFPKAFIFSCIGIGLTNIARKME